MRGSGSGSGFEGSGPSETEIHNRTEAAVSATIRRIIPKMYRSIKTKLIAIFDKRYATIEANASIVAAASPREKEDL